MSSARRSTRGDRRATEEAASRRAPRGSRRAGWICLLLIVAVVVVYAPVWDDGFINLDDPEYVTNHPHVSRGLTAAGVVAVFTTRHGANWHPLTSLSHMLDVQLWGLNPGPHHLTNVAFHAANTLLLFGLLLRMTGASGPSALAAALFAVHPLHVESVAWVAERKDVLSTLFWLLTLWAYVGYARRPRPATYLPVVVLFALGLMAKPMLVTLPFVLLLLDVWPLGRTTLAHGPVRGACAPRSWRALVLEKLPLFALTLASCVITFVVQYRTESVQALERFPLGLRLANAVVVYVTYLVEMLWPARLAPIYPYPRSLPVPLVAGSLLLLVGVTAAAAWAARRRPYLLVGWLWYLGTLVPVIGLVQVGGQPMADRYTYVPLIGVFIAIGWGFADLLARRPSVPRLAGPAAAVIAVAACAIVARQQVGYWRSSVDLWTRTLAVTRDNASAHNALGLELTRLGRSDEAIAQYAAALRIRPDEEIHNNLGFELARSGRYPEAMAHYAEALRIEPGYAAAHANRGLALAVQGKLDEGLAEMREALRLEPENANIHYGAALILGAQGSTQEAAHHYDEALRLRPTHVGVHYRLGLMLAEQGKVEAAAEHLRAAVTLEPGFEPARRALNDLRR